jgi:two-component system cell cycle response regulator
MRIANHASPTNPASPIQFPRPAAIANSGTTVLIASPDTLLLVDLERILTTIGLRVSTALSGEEALDTMASLEDASVILIDTRLHGMASGRLLAAIHESGIHLRCAIALIADRVSDEWIARLREGVIDDIVPRNSDADAWNTHLSTMRRGHSLYCELEQLRATAALEVQHDSITGAFNRETMITLLFRETDRVQRLHGSLCLVLFEIDDHDHWTTELPAQALDNLCREIAHRTGRILRSYDLLGRTGKFQFLLALPGCSPTSASTLVERLQNDVFGEVFPATTRPAIRPIRLTASFAITASRGRSPVVVLREAEQTLARAKQSGPEAILRSSEYPTFDDPQAATLFPETCMLV